MVDDFDKIFALDFDPDAGLVPAAEPDAPAPQIEAPQPVIEPTPAPAAPAAPAVAAEPQPEPQPESQPREDNGRYAPISALQEERAKRQDLERRIEELTRAQQPAPKPVEQPKAPDPYDDPQGFAAYQEQRQEQGLLQMRFQMSHEMAKTQFGEDVVEQARQWAMEKAGKDPAFDMAMGRQAHPLAWIVQQHKRDGLISQIGDDPDAWVRKRATELGIGVVPDPAVVAADPAPADPKPAPAEPAPSRSLANVPAAGGAAVKDVPTGPMSALDATFK